MWVWADGLDVDWNKNQDQNHRKKWETSNIRWLFKKLITKSSSIEMNRRMNRKRNKAATSQTTHKCLKIDILQGNSLCKLPFLQKSKSKNHLAKICKAWITVPSRKNRYYKASINLRRRALISALSMNIDSGLLVWYSQWISRQGSQWLRVETSKINFKISGKLSFNLTHYGVSPTSHLLYEHLKLNQHFQENLKTVPTVPFFHIVIYTKDKEATSRTSSLFRDHEDNSLYSFCKFIERHCYLDINTKNLERISSL